MNIPIAQYFKLPNCDVCVLYHLPASKQNLAQIAIMTAGLITQLPLAAFHSVYHIFTCAHLNLPIILLRKES